jgi:cation:H+ antiporter
MMLTLTFLGLAVVIVVAAMYLAKFAHGLADQTGLGTSITGLILLAGATSLPEFSVGFSAVRMNAVDLTAGDVFGSSLMNLLILAILDLASRRPGRILTKSAAAHALSGIVACVMTAIAMMGMLIDSQRSFLRIGLFSWGLFLAYGLCVRLLYLDQQVSASEAPEIVEHAKPRHSLTINAIGFLACAAVIFVTAPILAHTADQLAEITGLGRTFFGTVFVSTMTSLPEAISTFTAIRLGAIDMAIGNVLGSNAFNILILALTDVASPHPVLSLASDTHLITATSILLCTCVTMLCLLYRKEKRWWIVEPDAALVILMVLGSLFLVYVNREAS